MDARERLRRYLEQRRELGETELVLDGMSVEEVLRVVGAQHLAAGLGARREGSRDAATAAWGASTLEARADHGGDWRAALQAAEGGDGRESDVAGRTTPGGESPGGPSPGGESPAGDLADPFADLGVPMGLSVGDAAHARFAGPLAGVASLEEVAALVASCQQCPLYATANKPVPGEGSPTADLMCVGEAPGQTEDETGRPFVGAAGQLLTKILAAIELPRESAFIVNVLKHRPPGNRNPRPEEVEACSPYLVKQIALVRPKVIVAFGTFAAQTLLNTTLALGKLRGAVHRYYGVPLVVTYHPAALLRNPAWKRPTWEDVQLARRILDRARAAGA